MSRVFTSITISMALAVSTPANGQGVDRGYNVPLHQVLNLANGDHLLFSEFDPPHNLVRVNGNGDVVWARTIGQLGVSGGLRNVVETGSGTLLLGMGSQNALVIVCLDAQGSVLWAEVVDVGGAPIGSPVITRTTDGANILHLHGVGLSTADLLIKFDDNGSVLWAKDPILPGVATQGVIPMTPDGLLLRGVNSCTPTIARMGNDGSGQWYRKIDPSLGCWQIEHAVQLPDTSVVIACSQTSVTGPDSDMMVSRLDPTGQVIWNSFYDPVQGIGVMPGIDGLVAMHDGVVVQPGDYAKLFVRIDTLGNTTWTAKLPGVTFGGTTAPATGDSIWSVIFQAIGQPVTLWNRIHTDEPPSGCLIGYTIASGFGTTTETAGNFSTVDVPVTTTPYIISTLPITVTATQSCGSVGFASQEGSAFTVHYDPGSDRVIVQLPHMVLGMVTIELFDIRGNTVRRSSAAAADGTAQLNTQGLAAAPYLVRVDHRSMRSTGKVFITR